MLCNGNTYLTVYLLKTSLIISDKYICIVLPFVPLTLKFQSRKTLEVLDQDIMEKIANV